MSFTPIKDVNLEIMSKMDDETLLSVCATNKYAKELCQNESFWRNRFVGKYGEMAAKHKPATRSWKNHYMQVIIDISKWEDPPEILHYVTWDPRGARYSTHTDLAGRMHVFSFAPESFRNAFYLMDLGPYFDHKTAYQIFDEEAKRTNSTIDFTNLEKYYKYLEDKIMQPD